MSTEKKFRSKKIMTPEFRVSFPCLFEKRAVQVGQKATYSMCMLFPKTTKLDELKALIREAAVAEFKLPLPAGLASPIHDGDVEKPGRSEYAGHFYINAKAHSHRPHLVDRQCNPIGPEIGNAEEFYGGCYARATVTAYPYSYMGKKGVGIGLENVQKLREGEPFSGHVGADKDFEPLGEVSGEASEPLKQATDDFLA